MKKTFDLCHKEWLEELDQALRKSEKTLLDKTRLRELAFLVGMDQSAQEPYVVLRRKGAFVFLKGMNYSKELEAAELTDWNGWIPLQNFPLDPIGIENKTKVIADVHPDILILQEVEDRASLEEFKQEFFSNLFEQTLVVQGNDRRGQEIGIMMRKGFEILSVRNHSYDVNSGKQLLFNTDFYEYEIRTAKGNDLWILATHLQEQGENKDASDEKRREQAQKIATVYDQLYSEGKKHIAVVGTLNAVSYCYSLGPLLQNTNLKDITKHPSFNVDFDQGKDAGYFRMGAYRMGVNIKQKDYLLLSPELFEKVKSGGLNRKGIWSENQPVWSTYSSIQQKKHAASEHPAIWAEIDF